MKKNFLVFGIVLAFVSIIQGYGQSAGEETAVTETINKMFKAMELGDSAMLHSVFSDQFSGATIFRDKSGKAVLRRDTSNHEFLKAVGTPHKEVWHEEIWNLKIQIDGDFAQAWCDYAFYADKNFSHCGVDAFHLIKAQSGWKIFHIADTRRRQGCTIPQNIQEKYK
jgi:hypothetical protein